MRYIKISNEGKLETNALILLGASTKRNDKSKIGMFGSGNKYAIAYLLRNKYNLFIYSGLEEIKIRTVDEQFRDNTFSIIHINDIKTSITTDLGIEWKLWQAIRELYANAIDEGSAKISLTNEIEPKENETHFYIEQTEVTKDFIRDFDKYFSDNKKILFENEFGRIYEKTGSGGNIYRKGIRCMDWDKKSLYDYDLFNIEINEDRMAKYYWQVEESVWKLIFACDNKQVIRQILSESCNDDYMESTISNLFEIESPKLSEQFKEELSLGEIVPFGLSGLLTTAEIQTCYVVPTKIFKSLRHHIDEKSINSKFKISSSNVAYRYINSSLYQSALNKAVEFLKEVKFEIPFKIKTGVFDDKKIYGLADKENSAIVISDICMEKGIDEIINTIIEEYIHLKYDVRDETREFQSAIITEFISYMKKQNAYLT